jgi:hypothetical protein
LIRDHHVDRISHDQGGQASTSLASTKDCVSLSRH